MTDNDDDRRSAALRRNAEAEARSRLFTSGLIAVDETGRSRVVIPPSS